MTLIYYGPKLSWDEPKWSWTEMVIGRNDPEPFRIHVL